ncbi:MAG TPA: DedA family protein [Candidatus Angelobacter sp.]|jgi:membrane protein DedA with SNARE-associated domain|nr:DedA family protein [Candidatus Angelobacter sp.]
MIEKIISSLAGFIIAVISKTGYLGVLLLMGIESACIPLPSEIIMPFAGYLVYSGQSDPLTHVAFNLLLVATAGAIGCNVGSVIAYEIGHYGGRPLVERYGSYIFIGRHELELAERFFKRFGAAAVLIGRLLPVIRTFIALPAGIAKMPRLRFHIFTFIGSWPWCFALAWVGMKLGEKWDKDPRLKQWFHRLDAVIILLLLAGITWFVWSHWKGRVRTAEHS